MNAKYLKSYCELCKRVNQKPTVEGLKFHKKVLEKHLTK